MLENAALIGKRVIEQFRLSCPPSFVSFKAIVVSGGLLFEPPTSVIVIRERQLSYPEPDIPHVASKRIYILESLDLQVKNGLRIVPPVVPEIEVVRRSIRCG